MRLHAAVQAAETDASVITPYHTAFAQRLTKRPAEATTGSALGLPVNANAAVTHL